MTVRRPLLAGALVALILAGAVAGAPAQTPGQTPPPAAAPTPAFTLPPAASPAPVPVATSGAAAPPSAPPGSSLISFTGQLLDVRNGYAYFTTGDAFKLAPAYRVVDYTTGAPAAIAPQTKLFARATVDPAAGAITELAVTRNRLAFDAAYDRAKPFAATGSPQIPAPEINAGPGLTGRRVAVTFFVQVPPNTPLTDGVYIATDYSGWIANAMKMDRVDALHYRLTRYYASGTKFAYRYTRGSWTSVEVGEDGLEAAPHQFFAREVDARRVDDRISAWSDQNPSQPQAGPDAIPTPFNPNPFGNLPSTIRPPHPTPAPTPR